MFISNQLSLGSNFPKISIVHGKAQKKCKNRLFKCLAIRVHMEMMMSIRGFERIGLLWYLKKKNSLYLRKLDQLFGFYREGC